jgi:hypothetical protein
VPHLSARAIPTPDGRWALWLATLLAGLAFAVDVRYGVYAATITDSSGYVAAGDLWRTGEIYRPVPLSLWGQWPGADQSLSPLGFRPALVRGAEIVEYPLGFPVLIAAATALLGPLGAYLIAPAMHAVLVWSVFVIGSRLAGRLAGLVAAALLASNPLAIMHGVHPMSDLPAAAAWMSAWVIGLGAGPGAMLASGSLASLAVMIRPNLAPLAAVLAVAWLWSDGRARAWRSWQWRDAIIFGAAAAVGPVLVAWSQAAFYGGVLTSGYLGASSFFRLSHAWRNVATYPALFGQVHGWLPLVGLATLATAVGRLRTLCRPGSSPMLWTGLALATVNALAYVFYLPYDSEPFLRFFFVATAVAFVLYGAVVRAAAVWLWQRPRLRWLAPVLVVAALWPSLRRPDLAAFVMRDRRAQERVQTMGEFLAAVLPRDAVALGFIHTGAVAHYTGRNVVRLDLVPPDQLDALVDRLDRGGVSPVLVLDELLEEPQFRDLFKGTRYGALDWPPRAVFATTARIHYWVAADRARFLAGERWPTDVLR